MQSLLKVCNMTSESPSPCFLTLVSSQKTQLHAKGAHSLQKLVIPTLLPRLGLVRGLLPLFGPSS